MAIQPGEVYGTISGRFPYMPVTILFQRALPVQFTRRPCPCRAQVEYVTRRLEQRPNMGRGRLPLGRGASTHLLQRKAAMGA